MPELLIKSPADCSNTEIGMFIELVRSGGEVSDQGLAERILRATTIVFIRADGEVKGVAALKQPQSSYRRRVSSESGAMLSETEFPYELGWVFVSQGARGQGLSLLLSQASIAASKGAGIFATSRTDNIAMHRSLEKVGFMSVGKPYVSGRRKHSLLVFVRHGVSPSCLSQQTAENQ